MEEKYYIVHHPSAWGMGSNTDIRFVTESNLIKIIANEIEKMREGKRYDERFTGTWNEEVFCDSEDIEEVIIDVIKKRTTTSSTYAQVNDLVEVPSDIPVVITKKCLKNTIFRITNQWRFVRDIIVGDATLIRYKVDLTKCKENLGLKNGKWYEFVEYNFKNVIENHFSDEVEWFLNAQKYKIERMEKKLVGEKLNYEGKYIDDYFAEFTTTEYYEKEIEEAKKIIEKFSNLPVVEDHYEEYLYKQKYKEFMKPEFAEKEKKDYLKTIYDYPLIPDTFACEFDDKKLDLVEKKFSYNELFLKGANIHYLMADLSNTAKTIDKFKEVDMFSVLISVFGYD